MTFLKPMPYLKWRFNCLKLCAINTRFRYCSLFVCLFVCFYFKLATKSETRRATGFAGQSKGHSCTNAVPFSGTWLGKDVETSQHTGYTQNTRWYIDPNCCSPNWSKGNPWACFFFTYWWRTENWSDFSYDTFYVPFVVALLLHGAFELILATSTVILDYLLCSCLVILMHMFNKCERLYCQGCYYVYVDLCRDSLWL